MTLPFGSSATFAYLLAGAACGLLKLIRSAVRLKVDSRLAALLLLMVIGSMLASIMHGEIAIIWSDLRRYIAFAGLAVAGSTRKPGDVRAAFLTLGWTSGIVAGYAAVKTHTLPLFSLAQKTIIQNQVLPPNELASVAVVAILGMACWSPLLGRMSTGQPRIRYVHHVPPVFCLAVTASRTAVALALGVLVYAWIAARAPTASAQLRMALRVALLPLIMLAAVDAYMSVADQAGSGDVLRGRAAIWASTLEAVQESWPLGIGDEEATQLAARSALADSYLADIAGQSHSAYLDLITRYGVAGLVVGAHAAFALSASLRRRRTVEGSAVLLSIVTFGALRSLVESGGWLISTQLSLLTGVCWALVGSILIQSSRASTQRLPGPVPSRATIPSWRSPVEEPA